MKRLVLLLALFLVIGCTPSTKRLQTIKLGMKKQEVTKKIGNPTVVRGAITNKHGQNIEVWEYRLNKGKTPNQKQKDVVLTVVTLGLGAPALFTGGEHQDYWLYFFDDKLVQWGQAGDWKREADRIYEINFNTNQQVTK